MTGRDIAADARRLLGRLLRGRSRLDVSGGGGALTRVWEWLSNRGRSYSWVVVVLCLNVPFLVAALSRYPDGVGWLGFGRLYSLLVFLGYYVSILLFLLSCLFIVTAVWKQLFVGASFAVLTLALCYFVVDGVVYRVLRMHIDAFWLQYLVTTFAGLGISLQNLLGGLALLAAIVALEWWLFRLASRVRKRLVYVVGLPAVCVLAYVISQVIHIAAYEANDTRITAITPQLPFYYPVTSHRNAVKYGGLLPMIREVDAAESENAALSLRYPLHDVPCTIPPGQRRPNVLLLLLESWRFDAMDSVVTPRMYAFSKRASLFLKHFSSGNSTPAGVFPLFYGLHSTYWAAVKANNASIYNPVLVDVLQANGYAFGVYAESHFKRHKIKDTIFRGIEVHESFEGETVDARDRDMTDRLFAFMERQQRAETPFFGFAYYKSTHYRYYYPDSLAPFQPVRELGFVLASERDDPTPVLNDYRNSLYYVDVLVGELLDRMERAGILDNSIVIITSDHGEEFNDNGTNYWGHTGNFTEYQTRVPLIVYVPWKEARRVTATTAQVDIPPTLLQEGLGCGLEAADYSNGRNLFGPLEDLRPVVVSSYVNHAVIIGDDVFVVYPMHVEKYKLDDIKSEAGDPPPQLIGRTLEEMRRFYGGRNSSDRVVGSGRSPGRQ